MNCEGMHLCRQIAQGGCGQMPHHQPCRIAVLLAVTAPVASAQEPPRRQFSVADFGAVPGGDGDAGPSIRSAIAAAIASGEPAEVVLDEGVYRVGREPGGGYAISVLGARDLIVRGQGAKTEIVVTDPQAGCFRLFGCRRAAVVGLIIADGRGSGVLRSVPAKVPVTWAPKRATSGPVLPEVTTR